MELFGYAASIFIGLVLGLLGGGGSILSIPILVYLFNVEPIHASAYSLFIVGATSLVGAIPKYREHLVNVRTGLVFGIPSIVSIFCTRKWVIPFIPEILFVYDDFVFTKRLLLLGLFAVLMILAAVPMIRGRKKFASDNQKFRTFLVILEGLIIGFLTGLVGAGGGFLIIPALVLLTALPFKTAVGTSLFIISINSLFGFVGDLLNYKMDWPLLLSISALAIIGIIIGNRLSKVIAGDNLKKAFGWMILMMGSYILLKEI